MTDTPHGAERSQEIDRLFAAALELPPAERASYVSHIEESDAEIATSVRRLLELAERADPRLETGRWIPATLRNEPSVSVPPRAVMRGERLGAWRIVDELDHGGMSVVYLAERADGLFDQRVAIKFLAVASSHEVGLRRFEQERQILAALNHPNIARLLDGGTDTHGFPYIVMEYVAGRSIDSHCRDFNATLERRLELFDVVGTAVEFAHRHLVVHRDLKPSNILVTDEGDVKLLDFGIAKLLEPTVGGDFAAPPTQPLLRLLTPEYASPEQVRGAPVTTASDTYQLGALLYELLTDRRLHAFDNMTMAQIERTICEDVPEPPSTHGFPRLRGDLDNIIMKALEKQPERRYASVGALREDLQRYRQGLPVHARQATIAYRTAKFIRRHQTGVIAAGALLLMLLGYGATITVQARRISAEAARTAQVKEFMTSLFTLANPVVTRGETPTVVELVDAGARRVAVELHDQPDLQAELMTVLGQVYVSLGRYEDAAGQLRPAMETRQRLFGPTNAGTARSTYLLAEALHYGGRYTEAEQFLRNAVSMQSSIFGEKSAEVTRSLNQLGDLLHSRGELVQAEAVLRRALAAQLAMTSNDALDVAVTRRDLATVLRDRGAMEEADAVYRQSLQWLQDRFGSVDPIVARTRSELALLLAETGRHVEAEAMLDENFAAYRRLYPRGHAMEGTTFRNLGVLRLRQRRWREADAAFASALQNYARTLAPDNAFIPRVQRYRAEALLGMGDARGAAALAEESLARLSDAGLSVHPAIADALETLGLARLAKGLNADAIMLLERSLTMREHLSVASDGRLALTRAHLARARQR